MTEEMKKAGKVHIYGTPLIALVLAVLGYLDNRDATKDAASKAREADKQADVSQATAESAKTSGEVRLKRAYGAMREAIENQGQRIDDLEGWVVELEEFIEDELETDAPGTRREREARNMRLVEIRAAKRARAGRNSSPANVLDYDAVQHTID